MNSAQSRIPIQVLDEARDAIQTLHVGPTTITTGSVDGHTRTYDIRKGEICSDYLGRVSCLIFICTTFNLPFFVNRSRDSYRTHSR
jgi:hypothetical protein